MKLFFLQSRSYHLWDLLFGDPGRITRGNFEAILIEVYIAGAAIAILFLLLAILFSNSIAFEPGVNPKDPRKRRITFYVLGVFSDY